MHTEDEARQKRCPLAMLKENGHLSCVASQCMAWQWGTVRGLSETRQSKSGYCGLAGKDES